MIGTIYCIRNIINNKMYIGKTLSFKRRRREHLYELRSGNHHNKHLQKSWNKYGEDNFSLCILLNLVCDSEEYLGIIEELFIRHFNTNNGEFGYNATTGGEGVSGYKHTQEELDKVSRALKGRVGTFLGKKHSEKTRADMSIKYKGSGNGMFGKRHSEDTKRKISQNRKYDYKGKKKYSSFVGDVIDLVNSGESQTSASKITGVPQPVISLIVRGMYI